MSARDLPRFDPNCEACGTFRAECLAPEPSTDSGHLQLCWYCAHHVVDHARSLVEAPTAECECAPRLIFPADVIARRTPK